MKANKKTKKERIKSKLKAKKIPKIHKDLKKNG